MDETVDTITVVAATDGAIWAEHCDGVFRLDDDAWTPVISKDDWSTPDTVVHGLGARAGGGLWIVTQRAILAYLDGRLMRTHRRAGLGAGNYVEVVDLDEDGLWTSSHSAGATRYRSGEPPLRLTGDDVLPHDAVRFVFRGQEGHIWIGTDGGGLVQLRRSPVTMWGREAGLEEPIVRMTRPGRDGNLWVATHGEGIWRFDGNRFRGPVPSHPDLSTSWVWALHIDPDGLLWAGFLEDGAARVQPQPESVPLPPRPMTVYAIDDDLDDGLLFGTSRGLFTGNTRRIEPAAPFGITGTVTAIRRRGDDVWVGTRRGDVLLRRSGGPLTPAGPEPDSDSHQTVRAIRIAPDDSVWVVSEARLDVRTRDGWLRVEPRHGLGDLTPTDVAFDALGNAWVAGKRGITRFEPDELLAAANGGPPARGNRLNQSDGLGSVEINDVSLWSVDERQLLVFSTLEGLAVVDPLTIVFPSKPPRVVIDFVEYHAGTNERSPLAEVDRTTLRSPESLVRLPPGSDHVTIGLSAASFADPDSVKFELRLEGPTGVHRRETYDRTLHLHSPRVGRYRLEVVAETHHGKRSTEPAVLEFRVAPTLLETTWLVPSASIALIAIVATVLGVRSRTLRRAAERERGLRQSEQAFRQLERKLMETQRLESLGLLAGGVAHDFNNLLTGILANADLLKDSTSSKEEREMVDGIVEAGRRAAELCQQMLAYSGRGRMMVETVDLNKLVDETVRLVGRSVDPDVRFDLDLEPGVLAVDADSAQIRQVVMNLLTNASESARAGACSIRVRSIRRPGLSQRRLESAVLRPENPDQPFCCVEVHDDGEGMDRETLDRIFEPFFTTKSTGRGLGLAATLGIVQGHNGALFVESAAGEGSTFTLCLPASSSVPRPESNDDVTPSSGLTVRRVLVVDDDASIRRTVQRMFRRMNFVVLEAENGEKALEITQKMSGVFDLVFLDLTMPGMDGAEVLRRFRQLAPDVPVILMSGYARQDVLERVGDQSRVSFLQKPFGLQNLIRATNAAVPPSLQDLANQPDL